MRWSLSPWAKITKSKSSFFSHEHAEQVCHGDSLSGQKVKGEVRRKMNFTYLLGFVKLRDVVKVFPVSSSSFARKTTGRNQVRSHWGGGGIKTKTANEGQFRLNVTISDP